MNGIGFFTLGVANLLLRRPMQRAISSVVERAPDNCVVVLGL